MQKKYLMGIDLGTSSTKAALYQIDGTLVSEASAEVLLFYPKPGVVEQENEDFYTTAARTVRKCIESTGVELKGIAAIAFDSQMAGVGSIDENYQPAARFDSWLDMRCKPYIEWMDREAGDRITQLTGCPPTCDHGTSAAQCHYPLMISMVENVPPGSNGLFFSTHLGGRIWPSNPEMRRAWVGMSWSHHQEHFARAILESIDYEYA